MNKKIKLIINLALALFIVWWMGSSVFYDDASSSNIIFIGMTLILLVSILLIVFWDPLEKYDKSLDDPNHKKGGGFMGTYLGKTQGPISESVMKANPFSAKDSSGDLTRKRGKNK